MSAQGGAGSSEKAMESRMESLMDSFDRGSSAWAR